MRLIDDSPGTFIAVSAIVLYSVIGVEIVMVASPSVAIVAGTLTLIAVIAGVLTAWMHHSMLSDTGDEPDLAAAVVATPTPAPAPAPARLAQPVLDVDVALRPAEVRRPEAVPAPAEREPVAA